MPSLIVRDIPQPADLPFEVAPPEYEYPFLKLGDSTAFVVTRFYKQTITGWNADRLAGRYIPGLATDTEHPEAHLMAESKPTRTQSGMVAFDRTFARVPQDQVSYSSVPINKPAFPSNDYSGAYVDSTSTTSIANVWSAAVTSDTVGTRVPTGGTFTVTYKTSTTAALAYNESAANVATAINALADLITDATTVTVLDQFSVEGRIRITRSTGAGSMTDMSVNRGSLTPTCAVAETETSATSTYYAAPATIEVTEAAHGLVTGDQVRYYSTTPSGGGTLVTITKTGDNTFTIPTSDASAPPNPVYYRYLLRTYTPGTGRVVTKITEAFYLPGITPGISTPEDIPLPDVAINDAQMLALVINSATGWQSYDSDPIARWNDWPIYTQKRIEINVDNL